jgi:hypothetical protein
LSSLSGASGRHPQWESRWKAKFGSYINSAHI